MPNQAKHHPRTPKRTHPCTGRARHDTRLDRPPRYQIASLLTGAAIGDPLTVGSIRERQEIDAAKMANLTTLIAAELLKNDGKLTHEAKADLEGIAGFMWLRPRFPEALHNAKQFIAREREAINSTQTTTTANKELLERLRTETHDQEMAPYLVAEKRKESEDILSAGSALGLFISVIVFIVLLVAIMNEVL